MLIQEKSKKLRVGTHKPKTGTNHEAAVEGKLKNITLLILLLVTILVLLQFAVPVIKAVVFPVEKRSTIAPPASSVTQPEGGQNTTPPKEAFINLTEDDLNKVLEKLKNEVSDRGSIELSTSDAKVEISGGFITLTLTSQKSLIGLVLVPSDDKKWLVPSSSRYEGFDQYPQNIKGIFSDFLARSFLETIKAEWEISEITSLEIHQDGLAVVYL